MEDNNDDSERTEVLRRIQICLNCNRRVQEETIFCMVSEKPISEMTSNLTLQCPLGKF